MDSKKLYLDNAATTKPAQEVIDEILPYFTDEWYNPSSLYGDAVTVKKRIEHSRKFIADFIGCEQDEICFTSCASESNSMAIHGFAMNRICSDKTPCIITTKIEHKSILKCVEAMSKLNCAVYYLGVDKDGMVDLDELDTVAKVMSEELGGDNVLVSIMYANNEIGTVQDIKCISDIVHKYGAVFHTDAVQAFCHVPIDVEELGIDMMSVSGHKFNCFKGVGFLYKRNNVEINPIIYGSQNSGMRGGTEDVAGIIGLAKAVEVNMVDITPGRQDVIAFARDYFINSLCKIGCVLNGHDKNRLPNNINVMLPEGVGGEEMLYCLDMSGIKVSTGSACNSHSIVPSHVLKAIGISDEEAIRCIRITIDDSITIGDVNFVVSEMEKIIKLIKSDALV